MNHVTQSGKRLHCKRSGTSPSLSSVNHGKSASCRRKSGVGCQVAASNDCGSLGRACGKNHSNIDHWQYEFFIYIYHYIGLHFDIVSEFITYIYIHAHYIYTHIISLSACSCNIPRKMQFNNFHRCHLGAGEERLFYHFQD